MEQILGSILKNFLCGDEGIKPWYLSGDLLTILTIVLVVAPLSALKNIDFLSYTSVLSMLCMAVFSVVIVVYKFIIPCPLSTVYTLEDKETTLLSSILRGLKIQNLKKVAKTSSTQRYLIDK